MINSKYKIDYSGWSDEGGYCQVYPINNHKKWVFKEFNTKTRAQKSYNIHKKLIIHDLAPKILSRVCRLYFEEDEGWDVNQLSDWGYIIEKAMPVKHTQDTMVQIQNLVDQIYTKTGLKFWDCHWYNVGLVNRRSHTKIVCIDTGKESFDGYANAWALSNPGPKCEDCNSYKCECEE